MFRTMFTWMLLMTLLGHTACQPGQINLVTNGASKYVIVIPEDAGKNETHAAGVLQDYVKRISGATLPLIKEKAYRQQPAIFIGNTGAAEKYDTRPLKNEGFLLTTDVQGNLYIKGSRGKGVVYGVYTLLEKYCGCRKYANIPATVPHSTNLHLPAQLTDKQEPAFQYRETYYPAAFDNEYLEWHHLQRFEDLWGLWGHSFFKLVPPNTYFAAHPEYYALVNGSRQATQLCLSNEAVFKITVDYLRKAIAENPDALYWSIAAEDGGGFCTCDQCSKINAAEGSTTGTLIRFVNRVAAAFPEQQFTTLAYQQTARPPRQTKPAANVYIMLSSIDAYRQEPLSSTPSAAGFRKNLQDWGALSPNLFVWDYTTQFTNYLAPFPDYNNLQANLQYFAANKVKGVFSQGSADTYSDMAELNSYLQAKLLWNPDKPATDIITGFLDGYYGKAGPFIAQYLQALSDTLQRTKAQLDIYGNPANNFSDYLSPAAIDKYAALLDQAEKAVDGDTLLSTRVRNARLPLEYTVLQQSRRFGTKKHGYLVPDNNGNGYIINPRWPGRVQQFVEQCKKAGVTLLAENGISPDAYQQEWAVLFARKWVNSLAFQAPVKLLHPYAPEYPANKEQTLTDGVTGTNDFSVNWLFIYGKDLVATIDLGANKTIQQISTHFLQDPRHYIFNPVDVVVESSADGVNFTAVGTQQMLKAEDNTVQINDCNIRFAAVQARYVRVTAHCLPVVPAWRGAPGNKLAAVCCDEVYVE
ncbi:MAG TPA: DUF4838 domain-containing protein [Chitinophaga sp.]|uniref:DUF4838 domain-containing protein n=1 Tax=Chitinophaga sp. TaxID=1869181 RepID=UPI002F9432CE